MWPFLLNLSTTGTVPYGKHTLAYLKLLYTKRLVSLIGLWMRYVFNNDIRAIIFQLLLNFLMVHKLLALLFKFLTFPNVPNFQTCRYLVRGIRYFPMWKLIKLCYNFVKNLTKLWKLLMKFLKDFFEILLKIFQKNSQILLEIFFRKYFLKFFKILHKNIQTIQVSAW